MAVLIRLTFLYSKPIVGVYLTRKNPRYAEPCYANYML